MARIKRPNYETDDKTFSAAAYVEVRRPGVAWYVLGWETEPDDDTEWSGYENRTGRIVAIMVGDDRRHTFDPAELRALERREYCGVCGQVGCSHDGYDREAL